MAMVAAILVVAVLAGGSAVLAACGGGTGSAERTDGSATAALRTVALAQSGPVPPSAPGGDMHVWLVEGVAPPAPTQATVLTDEQCEPDAQGISRCLNRLLLETGLMIAVRHPHDMSTVPCLEPGEKVNLVIA